MKKLVGALAACVALIVPAALRAQEKVLEHFITARGDQLYEGDRPFRIISFNIPKLQMVEDNIARGAETPWCWPNEFELTDALESVRQIGGTVVRTYVLSVRREAGADIGEYVYVRGPGDFNEEAFRTLDLALEVANRTGVRLIIPLVDNWKWQGGRGEYAAFRGKEPDDFWTHEQVIADFEATIRFVLTRINTRTGVAYKDDPAILGWETGNELDSPPEWTARIAALIKRLDPNHLVIDGRSMHGVRQESLDDPNVDVITTHHYPNGHDSNYVPAILAAREACRGKKPYFVGEFGFAPLEDIERTYDAVIESGASGALIWSLRFHHRDGGFYWHFEPAGARLYKAYHWPGFASGAAYEEREVLELTRRKAHQIRGIEPEELGPPAAPRLLDIHDPAAIAWQGSAGAEDYVVMRSTAPEPTAPWEVVGEHVDDSAVQYRPLFHDATAEPGQAYFYRVQARRGESLSPPSNVVGPIEVRHRTLVDECRDLSQIAAVEGNVEAVTGDDRQRREDVHRIAIPAGASVTYKVAAPMIGFTALVCRRGELPTIAVAYSADGENFIDAEVDVQAIATGGGDYNYLDQLRVESAAVPPGTRLVRIAAAAETDADEPPAPLELSRIEIRYDGR
jgi:hypothetical protein